MSKRDPIRSRYYQPLELAEHFCDVLFYVGALLSIAVLFIERGEHPGVYNAAQIAFSIDVLALFVLSITIRLYFGPRAMEQRAKDFISAACDVNLTHERTDGYYNNTQADPLHRVAAQVLENTHFTKIIALRMAQTERMRVGIYIALWLVCVMLRRSDLGLVAVASQAIFSEQIVSRWLRLEWLRAQCEKIYESVFKLIQSKPETRQFNAMALEALTLYETTKANATITLSTKLFDKLNDGLTAEWKAIKASLNIT